LVRGSAARRAAAGRTAKGHLFFVRFARQFTGASFFQEDLAELAYVNGRNLLRADHMEYG
jgi:hypothetical protein